MGSGPRPDLLHGVPEQPDDVAGWRRRRWRWRLRGAWMWPLFFPLTLAQAFLIRALPLAGERGPDSIVPAIVLCGFINLVLVAAVGPLCALVLRRVRRDLPRAVAINYCGTGLLIASAAGMLAQGVAHHDELNERRADRAAAAQAAHSYIARVRPELRTQAAAIDVLRYDDEQFRACVPDGRPRRSFCLIVSTDRRPPGVKEDGDHTPNEIYRVPGGLR